MRCAPAGICQAPINQEPKLPIEIHSTENLFPALQPALLCAKHEKRALTSRSRLLRNSSPRAAVIERAAHIIIGPAMEYTKKNPIPKHSQLIKTSLFIILIALQSHTQHIWSRRRNEPTKNICCIFGAARHSCEGAFGWRGWRGVDSCMRGWPSAPPTTGVYSTILNMQRFLITPCRQAGPNSATRRTRRSRAPPPERERENNSQGTHVLQIRKIPRRPCA